MQLSAPNNTNQIMLQESLNSKIMTAQEYISQGKEKTEKKVWFWPTSWYVMPYALSRGEWDIYDAYLSVEYPVQRFLRETCSSWRHSISFNYRTTKRTIKNYLRHPRKDFRDAVFSKHGDMDMVEMIVLFHLNCVVELVEKEKYFETCCSLMDAKSEFELELKEAYDYAKTGRAKLIDEVDNTLMNMDNDEFQKYLEADKYLTECDTVLCDFVVKNREKFWT